MGHLRTSGFRVRAIDVDDLGPLKARHGVPARLASCHTALIDGYVVEGHVPADVIRKLLADRPPVAGIGVPDMPLGSPGMEVPGQKAEPYQVLAFDRQGRTRVYASR